MATDDPNEMTPLQRYLAKQKGTNQSASGEASAAPERPSSPPETQLKPLSRRLISTGPATSGQAGEPEPKPRPEPHTEDTAPQRPQAGGPSVAGTFWAALPSAQPSALPPEPTAETAQVFVPAGFARRFGAFLLDSFIIFAILGPVSGATGFFFFVIPNTLGDFATGGLTFTQFLSLQVITFVYYGWFYRERGATPGKMAFGLRVLTRAEGKPGHLGYVRTYLRETIGKVLSFMLMGAGFIIALFRRDHRTLHDMIFDTQVVRA